MATFPTGVSALSNPTTADKMNVVSHAAQHIAANDEIDAIETALGASLANVVIATQLDTDVTLSADSNAKVATQKAVKAYADAIALSGGGIPIGYLDTDVTLATDSDTKVATQKATKAYVASTLALAGLGTRVFNTIAYNVIYQAATDIFIGIYVTNASGVEISPSVLSDSNASPAKVIMIDYIEAAKTRIMTGFVKKGDYFKLVGLTEGTTYLKANSYYIPLGS